MSNIVKPGELGFVLSTGYRTALFNSNERKWENLRKKRGDMFVTITDERLAKLWHTWKHDKNRMAHFFTPAQKSQILFQALNQKPLTLEDFKLFLSHLETIAQPLPKNPPENFIDWLFKAMDAGDEQAIQSKLRVTFLEFIQNISDENMANELIKNHPELLRKLPNEHKLAELVNQNRFLEKAAQKNLAAIKKIDASITQKPLILNQNSFDILNTDRDSDLKTKINRQALAKELLNASLREQIKLVQYLDSNKIATLFSLTEEEMGVEYFYKIFQLFLKLKPDVFKTLLTEVAEKNNNENSSIGIGKTILRRYLFKPEILLQKYKTDPRQIAKIHELNQTLLESIVKNKSMSSVLITNLSKLFKLASSGNNFLKTWNLFTKADASVVPDNSIALMTPMVINKYGTKIFDKWWNSLKNKVEKISDLLKKWVGSQDKKEAATADAVMTNAYLANKLEFVMMKNVGSAQLVPETKILSEINSYLEKNSIIPPKYALTWASDNNIWGVIQTKYSADDQKKLAKLSPYFLWKLYGGFSTWKPVKKGLFFKKDGLEMVKASFSLIEIFLDLDVKLEEIKKRNAFQPDDLITGDNLISDFKNAFGDLAEFFRSDSVFMSELLRQGKAEELLALVESLNKPFNSATVPQNAIDTLLEGIVKNNYLSKFENISKEKAKIFLDRLPDLNLSITEKEAVIKAFLSKLTFSEKHQYAIAYEQKELKECLLNSIEPEHTHSVTNKGQVFSFEYTGDITAFCSRLEKSYPDLINARSILLQAVIYFSKYPQYINQLEKFSNCLLLGDSVKNHIQAYVKYCIKNIKQDSGIQSIQEITALLQNSKLRQWVKLTGEELSRFVHAPNANPLSYKAIANSFKLYDGLSTYLLNLGIVKHEDYLQDLYAKSPYFWLNAHITKEKSFLTNTALKIRLLTALILGRLDPGIQYLITGQNQWPLLCEQFAVAFRHGKLDELLEMDSELREQVMTQYEKYVSGLEEQEQNTIFTRIKENCPTLIPYLLSKYPDAFKGKGFQISEAQKIESIKDIVDQYVEHNSVLIEESQKEELVNLEEEISTFQTNFLENNDVISKFIKVQTDSDKIDLQLSLSNIESLSEKPELNLLSEKLKQELLTQLNAEDLLQIICSSDASISKTTKSLCDLIVVNAHESLDEIRQRYSNLAELVYQILNSESNNGLAFLIKLLDSKQFNTLINDISSLNSKDEKDHVITFIMLHLSDSLMIEHAQKIWELTDNPSLRSSLEKKIILLRDNFLISLNHPCFKNSVGIKIPENFNRPNSLNSSADLTAPKLEDIPAAGSSTAITDALRKPPVSRVMQKTPSLKKTRSQMSGTQSSVKKTRGTETPHRPQTRSVTGAIQATPLKHQLQ